jgi:tetratricopeptide (TPR) repeat protein
MYENLDIQSLVQRYEQKRAFGKKIYLDAEEFAVLAEYYNIMGNDEEAVNLIDEGLVMHPANPELMLLKAKTLVFSEQYEAAMAYLKNMPDDDDIDFILLKIEALLHLKRDEEAKTIFTKVLDDLAEDEENKEEFIYFITELGYLFNDVDKYDMALALLEESLTLRSGNPDVYVDLAYAHEMKGEFEKAIEYNNKLLDLDPYSFDGWVNIGKLYSMRDRYDKALDAFDFALTIRENDVSVLKMKALTLYLSGRTKEAVKLFENLLKEAREDEALYDSLLEAYEAIEEYDEMLKLLDKKEELFGSTDIIAKRSLVYLAKEDFRKAKEHFLQIPENEKNTLEYHLLEGELAFYENDLFRSEMAYLKAALISEDNEDILDRLANVCVAQEKFEQAAEYLEQLLELDPDFPTAKSRLAFIRFEIGAKKPFEEVINQFSNQELTSLLQLIMGREDTDVSDDFSERYRKKILIQLNEARENRVLFRNIKY